MLCLETLAKLVKGRKYANLSAHAFGQCLWQHPDQALLHICMQMLCIWQLMWGLGVKDPILILSDARYMGPQAHPGAY